MAITIRGSSTCSICGMVLEVNQPLVAFTAFIADKQDPLWRFSDSAMHEKCFSTWEYRDTMIEKYELACHGPSKEQDVLTRIAVLGQSEDRADILHELRQNSDS